MTITLNLPPIVEARLREQAATTGKDVLTLVLEAVEAKLTLTSLSLKEILQPVHTEVAQSGMGEEAIDSLLTTALNESRMKRNGHNETQP